MACTDRPFRLADEILGTFLNSYHTPSPYVFICKPVSGADFRPTMHRHYLGFCTRQARHRVRYLHYIDDDSVGIITVTYLQH